MNNVLGMLGLAKRAGKVVTGEFLCVKAIKNHDAKLIIIAEDISEKGKKEITDACKFYNVEYMVFAKSKELGRSVGTESRMVVSVNDESFKNAILSKNRKDG